jgi:hypothetical protein
VLRKRYAPDIWCVYSSNKSPQCLPFVSCPLRAIYVHCPALRHAHCGQPTSPRAYMPAGILLRCVPAYATFLPFPCTDGHEASPAVAGPAEPPTASEPICGKMPCRPPPTPCCCVDVLSCSDSSRVAGAQPASTQSSSTANRTAQNETPVVHPGRKLRPRRAASDATAVACPGLSMDGAPPDTAAARIESPPSAAQRLDPSPRRLGGNAAAASPPPRPRRQPLAVLFAARSRR